jgi:hypothetical protein
MPRSFDRRSPAWLGLLGVVATSLGALGCPGTLDPALVNNSSGTAGASGTMGTGGSAGGCTGTSAGDALITSKCAVSGCHTTADAPIAGAGLDLTVDATIGSRLVGVTSPGDSSAGSACGGNTEPYLIPGVTPATGLLIQKIGTSPNCSQSETPPCCGSPMPFAAVTLLTTTQQQCIIQWATTLITAASQ